ncbi:putative transferase [Arabidopsis thaliana]
MSSHRNGNGLGILLWFLQHPLKIQLGALSMMKFGVLFLNRLVPTALHAKDELNLMVQGIVHWRFLWETMDGLITVKMGSCTLSMLRSVCSHGVISQKSFVWVTWPVKMKLSWTCLLELDILFSHFLAKAKLVYACEWNPHAIEALRRNVEANSVSERCIILEGDNRITAPKGVADRVNLGLIPSSEGSWVTAIQALRPEGGILHVHGNVKDSDESSWGEHVTKTLSDIARAEGRSWEVTVEHIEKVKWYAPRIRHLVADVRCR